MYGAAGLGKDHPVVAFLAAEGRVSSLGYYKDGFEARNCMPQGHPSATGE